MNSTYNKFFFLYPPPEKLTGRRPGRVKPVWGRAARCVRGRRFGATSNTVSLPKKKHFVLPHTHYPRMRSSPPYGRRCTSGTERHPFVSGGMRGP